MIIERVKKFFEFQKRSVHGPVSLLGVLNGIFILYPIAFFVNIFTIDTDRERVKHQ